MSVLRYLIEEFGDTFPHTHEEARGFIKGMAWMTVVLIVALVLMTLAYQRTHGG